jgi:hypothetical protein
MCASVIAAFRRNWFCLHVLFLMLFCACSSQQSDTTENTTSKQPNDTPKKVPHGADPQNDAVNPPKAEKLAKANLDEIKADPRKTKAVE